MADLASVESKMLVEETDFESPVSEQTVQKIGSNINSLIDDKDTNAANIATNTADIALLSSPNIAIGTAASNPSVTITGVTSGVVKVWVQPSGGASTLTGTTQSVTLTRGATTIAAWTAPGAGSADHSFTFIDTTSGTGSITYTLNSAGTWSNAKLVAMEIGI